MKKNVFLLLMFAAALSATCQPAGPRPNFNFDFEHVVDGMPVGWSAFGNEAYTLSLDSVQAKSGRYAARIGFDGEKPEFRAWAFAIPGSYPGKRITLSGYIKTQGVEGFAGLWMRIDPQVAFNNMQQEGLSGTTDWTHHSFTLTMDPAKTEQIVLGGLLSGKGQVWFDSLTVTIDGQDITTLKPLVKKRFPAQLDTAFDKGSAIELPELTEAKQADLKLLGLVWGFVKYHHPRIAKGDVNWDYELFRVLPSVLAARDEAERDAALVAWIGRLGTFEKGAVAAAPADVKFEPDLDWIAKAGLSEALVTLLQDIRQAKRSDDHFHIGMVPGVGNPDFKNERAYPEMDPADDGMRLLALYRYWNMIQYFFPYKDLIGADWKEVLGEFVPRFAEADDAAGYTLALLELIGRIHDTHANIGGNPVLERYFGERFAPVDVYFVEGQPVVTGYRQLEWAKASGLAVGDIIATVDGVAVADRVEALRRYTPASNKMRQLLDIGPKLLRSNDSIIRVEAVRDGKRFSTVVKTYGPRELTFNNPYYVRDIGFKVIGNDIGYINNGSLDAKDLPLYWERMQRKKGLIIDARNYPAHFPIHELSRYLMPGPTPFVRFSTGSVQQPGRFVRTPSITVGQAGGKQYDGKVVILVNEASLSSAEYHAMAYRVHPHATVMGAPTAGADGNVSRIVLPGDIRTGISGIGIYYPDGGEAQRVGIVPDIEARPTIEGIKAGRDEVLAKAIEFIAGQ